MSTQLLTYLVLSGGLAIGIFIAFMAYANVKGRQTGMQRLRNLAEAGEDAGAVLPSPHMNIRSFADTWQAGGLDLAIKQADLDVSKAAFMRIGLMGMAGGFALAYALLGGGDMRSLRCVLVILFQIGRFTGAAGGTWAAGHLAIWLFIMRTRPFSAWILALQSPPRPRRARSMTRPFPCGL